MKVSIIVPVYNSEKYLKDCLDSLVNQTLKEIEIIAIDDASSDKSLKILKNYEKKYPNIYVSSNIAKITNKELDYIESKGLNNTYYKDYIYEYIKKFGSATRQQINDFIMPKLPSKLSAEQLDNKVRYLLRKLKEENKIINVGSDKMPKWIINEVQ